MIKRYTPDEETLEGMREVERGEYLLYTDHIAEVCKLRDKILEVCAQCKTCDGTGLITISVDDREVVHAMDQPVVKTEPCEDCADLREVLGQ